MLRFMRKRYNAGFVRGVRLGKMNERYRIIELLNDEQSNSECVCENGFTCYRHYLIALIKGKNK